MFVIHKTDVEANHNLGVAWLFSMKSFISIKWHAIYIIFADMIRKL